MHVCINTHTCLRSLRKHCQKGLRILANEWEGACEKLANQLLKWEKGLRILC